MKCSKPPFSAASGDQSIVDDRALDGRAVDVGDRDAPRPQVGDVALLEEDDPVGVGEDRGHVGGQEGLAVADADHERHVHPGADEPVGLARGA